MSYAETGLIVNTAKQRDNFLALSNTRARGGVSVCLSVHASKLMTVRSCSFHCQVARGL